MAPEAKTARRLSLLPMPTTIDVAAAIDAGRFSGYQKLLVGATALMIILDGLDNQLLPNAIPSMMREWNLPRPAFANASAAAPLGMMIGSVLGGILGDRIGRRTALLVSVIVFALLTLAIAFVNSVTMLMAVRFLAGLGLGGAMPNATALAAEYVPKRQRPIAITLTIVCIPVGGVIAGLVAGQIIPSYGWRLLFIAGGVVPIALALALLNVLPESPRYLAGRRERWPELRRVLWRIGHPVADNDAFVEGPDGSVKTQGSVRELFAPALRRDTLALIAAFTSCLLAIWVGFLWIPAMLTDPQVGFSQPDASYSLSLFNFGGVAGAIGGALIIQRIGSRPALLGMSALAALCAVVMAGMPLDAQDPFKTMLMFTLSGGLLNAVQATMYALAAHVFPTAIRGTGVGTTVAVGRVGNVLASYVGSWALSAGGPPLYFSTWAVAMTLVFMFLAVIRDHIPRPPSLAHIRLRATGGKPPSLA
jgi:MFS transporter, AAHS family, 4-hydroxybenzoate transporter